MKQYIYRFETLSNFVERMTGYKVSARGEVFGINLPPYLHYQFGTSARRYYPYGYLVVLPDTLPVPGHQEMPDEVEWERERDILF